MIRVGIAGIGFMGMIHYLAYQKVRGVKVAALCEQDATRLAGDWRSIKGNFGPPGQIVDLTGIARYRDLDEMMADETLDLIDCCLPPSWHACHPPCPPCHPVARLPPPWHACTGPRVTDPDFEATDPFREAMDPFREAWLLTSEPRRPTCEAWWLASDVAQSRLAMDTQRFLESARHFRESTLRPLRSGRTVAQPADLQTGNLSQKRSTGTQ